MKRKADRFMDWLASVLLVWLIIDILREKHKRHA